MKEGARGAGGGRHRAEGVFVAVEVGLAVILLAGAGLMMQSVWRLLRVDPGFNMRNILTTQVALSPRVMASPSGIRLAYQQLLARVAAIPGVQSAAITSLIPLGDSDNENSLLAGRRTPAGCRTECLWRHFLYRHTRLPQRHANPATARTVLHGPG